MVYEKQGKRPLQHRPDVPPSAVPEPFIVSKQTPPLIRAMITLLVQHEAELSHPGLRSLVIQWQPDALPTLRASYDLPA
jgi:hypothetical protein